MRFLLEQEVCKKVIKMSRRERENITKVLAKEYNMVEETFKKEDGGENSPKYVMLPSGQRANRVFFTGTVTEKDETSSGMKMRVNDGSGNFLVYSSDEYQPEVSESIREIEKIPEMVAVVGKVGVFETDDGTMISKVTPEKVQVVDKESRKKGIVEAAQDTLDRLENPEEDNLEGGQRFEEVREAVVDSLENMK